MATLRDLKPRIRSIYGRNPLAEVIVAVKFPRQLTLEQQLPVELQASIKDRYPILQLKNFAAYPLPASLTEATAPNQALFVSKQFEFLSEDKKHQVSVTPDLLALTTTSYTRWEDFIERFSAVFSSFCSIYEPPLFTRVGLRYKDIIDKAALGLATMPWDRLINSDLLRPFTFFSLDLDKNPDFTATVGLELGDAQMRVNYGFVQGPEKQTAFLIDTDCYVDPATLREPKDAMGAVEGLHKYTSLAFSSCITDELHSALQPVPA
jgi:uncharacterized protein (TIGR04255 family)